MRSITRIADATTEDVKHDFIALATTDALRRSTHANGAAVPRARFDVHMK